VGSQKCKNERRIVTGQIPVHPGKSHFGLAILALMAEDRRSEFGEQTRGRKRLTTRVVSEIEPRLILRREAKLTQAVGETVR
jgi:hypothetical protein